MTPDAFVVLVLALLGALIGSFSNVLIYRMPRRESVAFPPSHCPSCDRPLSPIDLVPILSWAFLRGRCRTCRAPISARYPLVELLTALGYALLGILLPWSQVGVTLVGLCALFTLLLVIAFIDAETRTIPDELVLPGIALGVLVGLLNERGGGAAAGLPDLARAWQGALLGAGVISLIAIFGAW
ncbi:prepilin peptidase, partial [Deinococcus pimensis]|uniref:prepilin peptidase n=1 Tax=Deinococcus pimensis TaxID=309888 RepID=UPI0005EB558C